MAKRPLKGAPRKAPPKTLVKPLPHGGRPPRPRPARKRGPQPEPLIIPDIEEALNKLVKKPAKR